MEICEAFNELASVAFAVNAKPMNRYEGCWEHRIDERWEVSVNGHSLVAKDSKGCPVPQFSAAIYFNGFPAGIINPRGGVIAAGQLANKDTFIAACRDAVKKMGVVS